MNESKASYAITKILANSSLLPIEQQQVYSKIMTAIQEPDEKNNCQVCGASMEKYERVKINIVVTKALIKIAQGVHIKAQRLPFSQANNIYVSKLPKEIELTHTQKTNLNFVRLHGLIAKVKEDGKVQRGRWLITKRGWAYLRGQEVPSTIDHFRNRVLKTYEETTTIAKVLRGGEYSNTIETLQRSLAELPEDLE